MMSQTASPASANLDHRPVALRFADRSAVVTGAGQGIGRSIAMQLAREGARVAAIDLDRQSGEATAAAIRAAGGIAHAFAADVAVAEQIGEAIARAAEIHGGLHLAVNNAGIASHPAATADQSLADWDRAISVNLTGTFYSLKFELPEMLRSGGGAIVNVSSLFGSHGLAQHSPYVASKHGIIGLTRSAASEYAAHGVRINILSPGPFDTPMTSAADRDLVARMVPLGRLGTPAEAAAVACFLLSDQASFVTGAEFGCDGGMLS